MCLFDSVDLNERLEWLSEKLCLTILSFCTVGRWISVSTHIVKILCLYVCFLFTCLLTCFCYVCLVDIFVGWHVCFVMVVLLTCLFCWHAYIVDVFDLLMCLCLFCWLALLTCLFALLTVCLSLSHVLLLDFKPQTQWRGGKCCLHLFFRTQCGRSNWLCNWAVT